MSPQSKREYLAAIYWRYRRAARHAKSLILDEFCQTCRYHRKHAIRLLKHFHPFREPHPAKRGRKARYDHTAMLTPLTRIWLAANQPCGKRLVVMLPLWLPGYAQCYQPLPTIIEHQLLQLSAATIDRLLQPTRAVHGRRGRSTTKPGTLLKTHIPIATEQWNTTKPGFLEADTVAHCGDSAMGSFVYTIDIVDIATGWTEQRAAWGKGEIGVLAQIKDIEQSLPFPVLGFDSDNGSEFLNNHLLKYFHHRKRPIQFTRSRPYHKDDNAHIEQKNWTHVREWLGYYRFDHPDFVPLFNNLYTTEWRCFHNFFCPSAKLIEKSAPNAAKPRKHYDSPKTPLQRLLLSPDIPEVQKVILREQAAALNPFLLRTAIEERLRQIFALHRKINASAPLR
jgi:hypothetical protein